jgi:dihydrofolate reductase
MSRLRVHAFGISIDGYGAGPDQSLEQPMGVGGMALHEWVLGTRTFQRLHADFAGPLVGDRPGRGGPDDEFAARGFENVGAWILGRNMFAPTRGPWTDDGWRGWWGSNPPYHVPVFVLTHHARAPIAMEGGTTFHFVTGGIEAALEGARAAAGTKDVRLGGGVATVREYLAAGLVDELHLAISPVLLGRGEHLLAGLDTVRLGYRCTAHVATERATHVVLAHTAPTAGR